MATLSPTSSAAIARLRAYTATATSTSSSSSSSPSSWPTLPLSRRAAVLILLFADPRGELRVVLTERASTLNNYAGQVAFPGGKADSLAESEFDVARREAYEEIGLPLVESSSSSSSFSSTPATTPTLPYPFTITHLTTLPTNLAKTELGVAPCVAFLHATSPTDRHGRPVDAEAMLIPRLDAKEVAAVFSAPFRSFLRADLEDADDDSGYGGSDKRRRRGGGGGGGDGNNKQARNGKEWYKGTWTEWHETRWRMHNFYVPRPPSPTLASSSTTPSPPSASSSLLPLSSPTPTTHQQQQQQQQHFRVFGMTARILVDCARLAYALEPTFEHNSHFGDEALIRKLVGVGRMSGERRRGDEFRGEDVRALSDGSSSDVVGKGKL